MTQPLLPAVALPPIPQVDRATASSFPPVVAVSASSRLRPPSEARDTADQKPLDEAVKALQARVDRVSSELQFRIDEDLDRVVVTVVDRRDGSVLRQMPSEEALALAKRLQDDPTALIDTLF